LLRRPPVGPRGHRSPNPLNNLENIISPLPIPRRSSPGAPWFESLPCAITVCDAKYKILYMNDLSAEVTAEDGGRALIGTSLLDCHPPEARKKLRQVMASGKPNVYTIEKRGVKKMIYQCHWRKQGRPGGLVELAFVLPRRTPHHVRD